MTTEVTLETRAELVPADADYLPVKDASDATPVTSLKKLLLSTLKIFTNTDVAKVTMKTDAPLDAYAAGKIQYDPVTKTVVFDTGFTGVRVNGGQEMQIRFFNDTGAQIDNGTPVNAQGFDVTNNVLRGIVADATSPATSSAVIGVATHDVPNGEVGVATFIGDINDVPTSGLTASGPLYLGKSPELFTQIRPTYPANIVIMGSVTKVSTVVETVDQSDGKIFVSPAPFSRKTGSKSYSFTSQGILAGTYYLGGFYNFSTTDANLTQVSPTQLHGNALAAECAHASAIFGGAGVVDTGIIGLRVNGTSITDAGVLTPGDTETISSDITTLALDEYLETAKKWTGVVEYELFIVGGSPTAYSLDFNYGLSKYEDIGNQDFTITSFEAVGTAGANDSNFDIELMHHKFTGWTYAPTGFEPGDGVIVGLKDTLGVNSAISNGNPFSFKRTGLSQFVDGNGPEGIVVRVTAGQNNSVQSMNVHVAAVSEELT